MSSILNHYHFVAHSPAGASAVENLSKWLGVLHARTAAWVNRLDGTPGRGVWHNFWGTRLTFQKSYLARLNYVHRNALHHGLVPLASAYPWCSASWFEQTATPAQVRALYRFKTEAVRMLEFDPAPEW